MCSESLGVTKYFEGKEIPGGKVYTSRRGKVQVGSESYPTGKRSLELTLGENTDRSGNEIERSHQGEQGQRVRSVVMVTMPPERLGAKPGCKKTYGGGGDPQGNKR